MVVSTVIALILSVCMAATLVLVGVNVNFSAPYYRAAVGADYFIMFAVSYVLSLIAERIAFKAAVANCGRPPFEEPGK